MIRKIQKDKLFKIYDPELNIPLPLIVIFDGGEMDDELVQSFQQAWQNKLTSPAYLLTYGPLDWNKDYSPWPSEGLERNRPFLGKAKDTLDSFLNFYPELSKELNLTQDIYTAGYSLGGLMSLWSLYQTDLFKGTASCSGSFWYPNFDSFIYSAELKSPKKIYLSLGDKEEKTKNPILRTVGDKTREISAYYQNNKMINKTILEWNQGGHFQQPNQRLLKGIIWLLNN